MNKSRVLRVGGTFAYSRRLSFTEWRPKVGNGGKRLFPALGSWSDLKAGSIRQEGRRKKLQW